VRVSCTLQDGLDRIADVAAMERSKADARAWAALPAEERQRKEAFYQGQKARLSGRGSGQGRAVRGGA
jgi:hypothetical protein